MYMNETSHIRKIANSGVFWILSICLKLRTRSTDWLDVQKAFEPVMVYRVQEMDIVDLKWTLTLS